MRISTKPHHRDASSDKNRKTGNRICHFVIYVDKVIYGPPVDA